MYGWYKMWNCFREKDPNVSTEHVHDFGKWEVVGRVQVFVKEDDKYPLGTKTIQERACRDCGFVEQHSSEIM